MSNKALRDGYSLSRILRDLCVYPPPPAPARLVATEEAAPVADARDIVFQGRSKAVLARFLETLEQQGPEVNATRSMWTMPPSQGRSCEEVVKAAR